jgi:MSHA pilin protein MshA
MQNKHGFTLIELIIVIVILGVLSVTAAPFFIDVSTDARLAKLDALEGSMRSASSMVNYKARIENKTDCDTDPTVEVQGEAITLRCGFPCPHPNGITKVVDAEDGFTWVGGNCAGRLGAIDVQISDAPDPSNCKIRYAAARSEDSSPFFTPTTDGC